MVIDHAKVVMVKSGEQHVMAVLPADRRVDLEKDGPGSTFCLALPIERGGKA